MIACEHRHKDIGKYQSFKLCLDVDAVMLPVIVSGGLHCKRNGITSLSELGFRNHHIPKPIEF